MIVVWQGTTYTTSGMYYDTLQTAAGCDSVLTLDPTINNSYTAPVDVQTACDSLVWQGTTYTTSGIYYDTLQTITGCDSILMIDLTINSGYMSDTNYITTCDQFIWHGQVYDSTGFYIDIIQTQQGCDSVVSLYLSINYSTSTVDTLISCDTVFWNGNTFTNSGDYVDTLTTVLGCDSIIHLHIHIDHFVIHDTISGILCHGASNGFIDIDTILNLTQLVWSNGDTSLQISNLTAGSYELQLENVLGCDTTLTYVIAEYDDLDVNIFVTPTQCDTNTGTAAALLTATTFYPPYTYLWSNGDNSSSNADSLYSGPLTVQITDGNNCTSYHTTFVGDMDGPSINLVNIQDVSCNGFSDGTIDLDITGSGDLDIEWLTGEKTEDLSNLSGGIYTVTVTDTSNCFSTLISPLKSQPHYI